MRVLITGGLGFIGSYLEPALIKRGYQVTVMDRERVSRDHYIRGDICDYARMEVVFQQVRPDIVIHLAAMVSRREAEETPYMAVQTNVDGTLNVAILCQKFNARLIYAGSSEEYGTAFDGGIVVSEGTPLGYPTSMYSMTKRMSDEIIQYFAMFRGLTATTIRFFMLYGQKEKANEYRSAITRFIDAAKNDQPLTVHRGTARQWCYITDAIEGIVKIVDDVQISPYEIYNIGNDEITYTEDLAKMIIQATHSASQITLIEPEETIIPVKLASFGKMRDKFGWTARTGLKVGLDRIIGKVELDELLFGVQPK